MGQNLVLVKLIQNSTGLANSLVPGISGFDYDVSFYWCDKNSKICFCENALRCMPWDFDVKLTLIWVMAWCCQAITSANVF